MVLKNNTIVQVSKDAVSCHLEDEVVILNHEKGIYFGLSSTGAFIWDQIQKPKKVNELVELIVKEYDVDTRKCQEDINSFLSLIIAEGIAFAS